MGKNIWAGLTWLYTLLAILALSSFPAAADMAKVDEIIRFELPRAPLTPMQKRQLPEGAQNLDPGSFEGRYRHPGGNGKMPALVVIRTCHDASYYDAWLDRLNDWGFATLTFSRCQPPSFEPDDATIPAFDWKRGSLAAIGALNFLAEKPEIDAKKIGILSWSRLGMIPLSILNYEGFAQFFPHKFSAGVALYPFCSFARGPHGGPILIIAGAKDSWIDNTVCKRVERVSRQDDFPVSLIMLENATHGFDIPQFGSPKQVTRSQINPDGFAAGSGILGHDKASEARAIKEVKAFLEKHLR